MHMNRFSVCCLAVSALFLAPRATAAQGSDLDPTLAAIVQAAVVERLGQAAPRIAGRWLANAGERLLDRGDSNGSGRAHRDPR